MDPSLRASLLLMDPRFAGADMRSHSDGTGSERGSFDLSYDEARTNDVSRPLSNEQVSAGLTIAGQGFSTRLGINAMRHEDGAFAMHGARPGIDVRVGSTTLGVGQSHIDTPFGSRSRPYYRAMRGFDLGDAGSLNAGIMHSPNGQPSQLTGSYQLPVDGGAFGVQVMGSASDRPRPMITFGYRREF
jgi:hypothetical protein